MSELHVLRVFCGDDGSWGNPLGVFLDGGAIPEAERQAVAADLGFSETVFVDDPESGEIRVFTPAVEIPLRVTDAWTYAAGHPGWTPPFEFVELDSPAEVEALDGSPRSDVEIGMWAWIDEEVGVLRERVFAEPFGIPEDEATGAAAIALTARLGRALDIRQGQGSRIVTRPMDDGMVEIAGRVVLGEVQEYALAPPD